jgi:ribosome-binding factor A
VERELHHLVALFLQHDLAEPLPVLASVSAVDVTSDLRKAFIYFRLVGEGAGLQACEKILERNRKRAQQVIAKEVSLKFTPVLEFRFGHAKPDEQSDIDQMLADLQSGKHRWD